MEIYTFGHGPGTRFSESVGRGLKCLGKVQQIKAVTFIRDNTAREDKNQISAIKHELNLLSSGESKVTNATEMQV